MRSLPNAEDSLHRLAEESDAAWSFLGARSHELVALWRVTDPAITEDLRRFLDKSLALYYWCWHLRKVPPSKR